jgi:hypothetical protein
MRYVHYQPQTDAAELLGQRFQGTAAELAALLGDPANETIPGRRGTGNGLVIREFGVISG